MNTKDEPLELPVGFCNACLAAIDAGTFIGQSFDVRAGARLVGGYCPHNQVSAVRFEDIAAGVPHAWRLVSPASEEKHLEIMLRSGARGKEIAARVLTAKALRNASQH